MDKYIIRLWVLSFLISVTAVILMVYKWVSTTRPYGVNTYVISSESQLEDFLLY